MPKYYVRKPVVDERRRATKTLPDQSLSIRTIIERFTRGQSINAVKREAVYVDQEDVDLEQIARSPFDEKHRLAETLRDEIEAADERAERAKKRRESAAKDKQQSDSKPEVKPDAEQSEAKA